MGKDSIVPEIWNKGVGNTSERKSRVNSLLEQSDDKIQTPCRYDIPQVGDRPSFYSQYQRSVPFSLKTKKINESMPWTGEDTSEDTEHDAAITSGGHGSSKGSQQHDKKEIHTASAEKLNEYSDSTCGRFEEYLRSALEIRYQLAFILMCLSSNLIEAYHYTCQGLNEINSVHFEEKQTGHKPPGKHTAKKYLLRLCRNIAGRRHELCHVVQKFFDLDVCHFQSSQSILSEMDLAYDSKLDKLWTALEAVLSAAQPFITHRDHFKEKASEVRMKEEEEMRYEGLRLRSFHGVDMNVSYLRLAAAGFYATKNGDETKCFSCGIRHKNWQRGDNPFVVHTRRSPTCKHLHGKDVKNVAIQLLKSSVNQPSIDRPHQSTQQSEPTGTAEQDDVQGATGTTRNCIDAYGLPPSFPAQLSALSARDNDEVAPVLSFDASVHPHYSTTARRLESFKLWPEGHSQRPEELVRAGFFYAGYSDCVRCFVCGVGLRTWEEGDDPWTEHVRWRSSCAYVEAVRGKRFIIQTLAALGRNRQESSKTDQNQQASSSNNTTRNNEGEDILRNTACAQAVEMGFSSEQVKAAARATMNPTEKTSLTLDVLLETILVTDGEVSEQTKADLPMESEVPERAYANNGSCSFDKTQEVSRITEAPVMSDNAEERRRSSDPQSREALQRLSEDKDSSSVTPSVGTGLTGSSLETRKEEDEDFLTSNPPRREFIVTGRRTSPRTNVFYNNNDFTSQQPGSSIDTTSSLGNNNHERNREDRLMGASVQSMPSERQRHEKIKNKSQRKDKSKEDLRATAEETRQLKESSACKICLEDLANILFLPCGHLVACAVCAPALERCPVCRKHVRGSVRVHLADMISREKYISYF
ncbi:baculoviral IAP repeat-containing protein 3-like [Haliotis asinina]|uniref:baculoviral IAP repeat-containing protein 3-like n=1 Tax=Haliotis asinina TaxID=109174 RepID=UPI003531BC99